MDKQTEQATTERMGVLAVGSRVAYDFDGYPCGGVIVARVPFDESAPVRLWVIACSRFRDKKGKPARHEMPVGAVRAALAAPSEAR